MSDAIRDVLAEIFGERGDKELGRALGVAHTTIMRARAGRYIPSPDTVERIAKLATAEQARRLWLAVTLATIRVAHPASVYPDAVGLAQDIAGDADPVLRAWLDNGATHREALRQAVSALRIAAATAPTERHRRKAISLMRRLADHLAGVSHG